MNRYFGKYHELIYFLPPPSSCARALHTDVQTLIEDLMSSESRYFDGCCKIAKRVPFLYDGHFHTKNEADNLWKEFLARPDADEFYPIDYPFNLHNYTYQDNVAALRALGLTPYQVGAMCMLQWPDLQYKLRYLNNHGDDSLLNTLLRQGKKLL